MLFYLSMCKKFTSEEARQYVYQLARLEPELGIDCGDCTDLGQNDPKWGDTRCADRMNGRFARSIGGAAALDPIKGRSPGRGRQRDPYDDV
jgi:hypothetical protein